MSPDIAVLRKDDNEHPVPEVWRPVFRSISQAFASGDIGLRNCTIECVMPVEPEVVRQITEYAADYGERLAPLNESTWDRSVYRWMDNYWHFVVDLTTESEPVSDLALMARLYEEGRQLQVCAIYVP